MRQRKKPAGRRKPAGGLWRIRGRGMGQRSAWYRVSMLIQFWRARGEKSSRFLAGGENGSSGRGARGGRER